MFFNGYANIREEDKELAEEIFEKLAIFDTQEGLAYRKFLLRNTPDRDKRFWSKKIVPYTTLNYNMNPEGNNLYLLILQKYYFNAADKRYFINIIDNNIDTLCQLESFLEPLADDEWVDDALFQVQKIQGYWISFKENLRKYKPTDNRLLYSVRFLIANECTRQFMQQFLDESEFSSWIYDNIMLQQEYRRIDNEANPNEEHMEESDLLLHTENWIIDWLNEEEPDLEENKALQDLLKLIFQKKHAFYFKNHAANDWWMLIAFCNDASLQGKRKSPLNFLIKKLENSDRLSDDEVAYYLMAICSEFTISYAEKMGMSLVNLEHQSVIKKAEQSKILPLKKINVWRRMNYDRNQIAHGYNQSFNRKLRQKLTEYITLIKENKL